MRAWKIITGVLCIAAAVSGCTDSRPEKAKVADDDTLQYWVTLNANVSASAKTLNDTEFAKELQKQTGIKVHFVHPPQGQENSQLSIMMSSEKMADIIEFEWKYFPGGIANALQQGYITELNYLIEHYSPNYREYLRQNPEVEKAVKTNDGKHYVYPFIRGDEIAQVYNGPMVRKDWLDELGLAVPETIGEWHTMLKLFKEQKGADAPLSCESGVIIPYLCNGNFVGAYGVIPGYYQENGVVKYGAVSEEYKQFLNTFAGWYQEGLIDRNISNIDSTALKNRVLNGKTGATIGYAGSNMGVWRRENEDIRFVAAPYPVLSKGEKPKFGQRDQVFSESGSAAISSSCKNPEKAARLLDFGYSKEGYMLYNFGVEGESYNIIDGYPTYTNKIMKSKNISAELSRYTRAAYFGPFVQAKEYVEQYYNMPEQREAIEIWANTDMEKYELPYLEITAEESTIVSSIATDVGKITEEYFFKTIMNIDTVQPYDEYVRTIEEKGIDKVIEIYQRALDAYNAR